MSLTGDESLWANVLGWVRTGLASDRAAAARVVPRMEGEFRARFGHDAPGARGPD